MNDSRHTSNPEGGEGQKKKPLRPNEWSIDPSTTPPRKMNRRNWTKEEERILREYYKSKGGKAVAKLLNRTLTSVQNHAYSLGIEGNVQPWTHKQELFLKRNYGKLTAVEIAKRLKRSEDGVRAHLAKLGLTGPASRPWTEEEENYLRAHYGTVSNKELGDELERTEVAVQIKGKLLGLTDDSFVSPDEKDVQWILRNFGKMPYTEMARRIGCSAHTVQRIATKHGLSASPTTRPWTEEDEA